MHDVKILTQLASTFDLSLILSIKVQSLLKAISYLEKFQLETSMKNKEILILLPTTAILVVH